MTLASTTREGLARAAIEGMLCGLADGLDAVRGVGVEARRILLIGGAAQNPAVASIAAQVFDVPVRRARSPASTSRSAPPCRRPGRSAARGPDGRSTIAAEPAPTRAPRSARRTRPARPTRRPPACRQVRGYPRPPRRRSCGRTRFGEGVERRLLPELGDRVIQLAPSQSPQPMSSARIDVRRSHRLRLRPERRRHLLARVHRACGRRLREGRARRSRGRFATQRPGIEFIDASDRQQARVLDAKAATEPSSIATADRAPTPSGSRRSRAHRLHRGARCGPEQLYAAAARADRIPDGAERSHRGHAKISRSRATSIAPTPRGPTPRADAPASTRQRSPRRSTRGSSPSTLQSVAGVEAPLALGTD